LVATDTSSVDCSQLSLWYAILQVIQKLTCPC